MVYATGDCHADWTKFSSKAFPEQKGMTRDDYVIVCGDFGIWSDTPQERHWLDWLEEKNFTLCFVCGNHENFDRLYSDEFPVVDFHGGKAHKIRENIYHLMRGYVFDLCGKKFYAFGGASSHDVNDGILEPGDYSCCRDLIMDYKIRTSMGQMLRINHISWWKEEIPTQEEMDFGWQTLKNNNYKVDYIITHCCPQHIADIISDGFYKPDRLTEWFDFVSNNVTFTAWLFGHYHDDKKIEKNYFLLYDQFVKIL